MLANPLFINNEVKLDCEFSFYKSRSFISPSVNLLFVNNEVNYCGGKSIIYNNNTQIRPCVVTPLLFLLFSET